MRKQLHPHHALISEMLARFNSGAGGKNVVICTQDRVAELVLHAATFLQGKYPTIAVKATGQLSLGAGPSGDGKGFVINYIGPSDLARALAGSEGMIYRYEVPIDRLTQEDLELIEAMNTRFGE